MAKRRVARRHLLLASMVTVVVAASTRSAIAVGTVAASPDAAAVARRCTLAPGAVRALLVVQRDTLLPFAPAAQRALSYSTPPGMDNDSLLPTADTPMPSARVRLLRVDAATRAVLAAAGVFDAQPEAFIRAAPYRADCRTIRWTDSLPWVQAGDTGYVVANLASRELWIGNTPVLVIADVWSYPYPRYPGPSLYPPARPPLASASALFGFEDWMYRPRDAQTRDAQNVSAHAPDSVRARSLAWARANTEERERDPLRARIRESILTADFEHASALPSRFRGTYRIDVQSDGQSASWQFRTVDRPAYRWLDPDTARTIAELVASPHVAGYRLVGYAADSAGNLAPVAPRGSAIRQVGLVWLSVADRPTMPGSDSAGVVTAMLEFQRKGAPREIWSALDAYVRPQRALDSAMLARMRMVRTAGDDQPQLPLTLRVGRNGEVFGDTTVERGGRMLRVRMTRVDTVAVGRPF